MRLEKYWQDVAGYFYKQKEMKGQSKDGRSLSHVTCYVAGNVGDTALSQCIRKTVSACDEVAGWDLINVRKKVSDKTVERINKTEAVLIGGGGLFLPDTNRNEISGWQWAISKDQLEQIQVPMIVYSVGYNYFRGQKPSELFIDNLNALAGKSVFLGMRNGGSISAVKALLADEYRKKVEYQPCTTTLIRKLYSDCLRDKTDQKTVAFNVALDRAEMRFGADRELILEQIAEAAFKIQQAGYSVYYVKHCVRDGEFVPYLDRKNVSYKLIDAVRWFPRKLYDFYNSMDVAIGMRGHAQMIPFGLNCEIISLCAHDKMWWFLEDIHARDWGVEVTEEPGCLADRIMDKFTEIHERNRGAVREQLFREQDRLWEITRNNWTKISEKIG